MPRAKKPKRSKSRDFRDPEGNVWDSPFEWHVYVGLRDTGHSVRRTDQRDSFSYHTSIVKGNCLECGSDQVVQDRIYTPDLFVVEAEPSDGSSGLQGPDLYYLECKGYLRQDRRAQLAAFARQRKDVSVRILFTQERKLTKTLTNIEYALKYFKWPAAAWNDGAFEWRFP